MATKVELITALMAVIVIATEMKLPDISAPEKPEDLTNEELEKLLDKFETAVRKAKSARAQELKIKNVKDMSIAELDKAIKEQEKIQDDAEAAKKQKKVAADADPNKEGAKYKVNPEGLSPVSFHSSGSVATSQLIMPGKCVPQGVDEKTIKVLLAKGTIVKV